MWSSMVILSVAQPISIQIGHWDLQNCRSWSSVISAWSWQLIYLTLACLLCSHRTETIGNLIENATRTLDSTACISAACLFQRPGRLRSRLSWVHTRCPLAAFPFRCEETWGTWNFHFTNTAKIPVCWLWQYSQVQRPTAVKQLEALSKGRNSW